MIAVQISRLISRASSRAQVGLARALGMEIYRDPARNVFVVATDGMDEEALRPHLARSAKFIPIVDIPREWKAVA